MTPCPDGCGREISNWTQACCPVAPWDSPGLPPKPMLARCTRHVSKQYRPGGRVIGKVLCAYRGDDPAYCPVCHARRGTCACEAAALKVAA